MSRFIKSVETVSEEEIKISGYRGGMNMYEYEHFPINEEIEILATDMQVSSELTERFSK